MIIGLPTLLFLAITAPSAPDEHVAPTMPAPTTAPVTSSSRSDARIPQPSPDAERGAAVAEVSQARSAGIDAHLSRVTIWAAGSILAGTGLLAATIPGVLPDDVNPGILQGFAIQSVAWGLVDLGIVVAGRLGDRGLTAELPVALDEEDQLSDVLWLNVGLDVGYMMGGTALMLGALAGAEPSVDIASHGAGIVVQGAALAVLDGIAVAEGNSREERLRALAADDASGVRGSLAGSHDPP